MAKRPRRRQGFAEAAVPFRHETPSLETYALVHGQVAAAYGHRCAFTGQQGVVGVGPEPVLTIAVIRPRDLGGALHVTNFIALSDSAAAAFAAGHLTVGVAYELAADLSRIDPELLERLTPLGRMLLPEDRAFWPDPLALDFHRRMIFSAFAG
jgi:hypothetical protein